MAAAEIVEAFEVDEVDQHVVVVEVAQEAALEIAEDEAVVGEVGAPQEDVEHHEVAEAVGQRAEQKPSSNLTVTPASS